MNATITTEQHQRLLAETVVPQHAALDQAKRTIAMLQTKLYGVRAETSQVLLTAEGQLLIDATWGSSKDATPAPEKLEPETVVRRPRDRRGLAQRHPHLALEEIAAVVPAELAEQVAAGVLIARRSGRHQDELVVPATKPFVRRVHEIELLKAGSTEPQMQIMPERIVPGGDLADETIYGLVVGKHLDAIPFHRQLAQLDRVGVELPKQTVNDAVNAWGDLFAPLTACIVTQVLASNVVHADASWQRLQAKETCERVHVWTLLGGGQVAYRLTEDLKHARAADLVPADFRGRLVTDAWPGWFTLPLGDRLALCNAHARQPFADWLKRNPHNPDAQRIIALYRDLARREREADDGPPDDLLARRRRIRSNHSRSVMDQLKTEAERIATAYPASHILDYWDGLTRFLNHPELPPDPPRGLAATRLA